MEMIIAQSPHLAEPDDRQEIWNSLSTGDDEPREIIDTEEKLDRSAFNLLKRAASENPRIVVK